MHVIVVVVVAVATEFVMCFVCMYVAGFAVYGVINLLAH